MRPAIASRWITALVEPPIAPLTRIAFSNACARQDLRHAQVLAAPSRRCGGRPCGPARSGASRPPGWRRWSAGRCRAPRPCEAMVEAVPMVMQWPAERDMPASASMKSCSDHLAGRAHPRTASRRRCRSRWSGRGSGRSASARRRRRWSAGRSSPRPSAAPAWSCRSRPAARRRRSGLPRIDSSTSMLARLRNSIAVGRRFDLAERHHRKLEREAAGLVDAALHVLGELAEMGVAGRQLGPGVADADDRPAVEQMRREGPGSSSSCDA